MTTLSRRFGALLALVVALAATLALWPCWNLDSLAPPRESPSVPVDRSPVTAFGERGTAVFPMAGRHDIRKPGPLDGASFIPADASRSPCPAREAVRRYAPAPIRLPDSDHPAWKPDVLGRVVLAAPRGATPSPAVGGRPADACSRSTVARMSQAFAGSGLDFNGPLPTGISVPPPAPPVVVAGPMAATGKTPAGPMASISTADVHGLSGTTFVATVLNSEGLDGTFFDVASADTLAAVAEPRVQEIVDQLNADLSADPLANAARIEVGLYFLRAAAYVDFYSAAIDYPAPLKTSVANLLIAVGQNPQFLAPGFLDARAEWAVVIDSWMVQPAQVDLITSLLRRYLDTPALQDGSTVANRTEGKVIYALLYGMARTANQDPNWAGHYTAGLMQALSDYALVLPDQSDIQYLILNGIYTLGRLRTGEAVAAYQGQAHQILSQVLQVRPVDSAPYLEALMALENAPYNERLADGTAVDVDGYREQLKARVFSHTYTYDGGTMIVCTPLDAATAHKLYDALREDRAQFFRVTQALRPIDDDPHGTLTLRIYGTMADYHAYQRFLYGLSTDNGGMYIEDWATFFTYQRTTAESIYTLEELTRHEYIHYLDAYYLLVPSFGDSPWYDNDHLTWHAEGLAEFLAGSRRVDGVPVRRSQLNGATSSGTPMTIAEIIGASYSSGFGFYPNTAMFFAFLHEEHPDLHWAYFQTLYTNNLSAYDALTQPWRTDAALQAEYDAYLARVQSEFDAGTRVAAEDIPTDYKPDVLYGVTPAQIQADLQTMLPAGPLTVADRRFHFATTTTVTVAGADVTTPERFQAEFGRQLDDVLTALTPVDAHYRCATAWFEQLGIGGHTATAAVHVVSWYNPNTAPALVADLEALGFDPVGSDDASEQTLHLHLVNTSPDTVFIESITLSGTDARAFDVWGETIHSPSLAGRGTLSLEITLRPSNLAGLSAGTHTATLNIVTSNGTPLRVEIPVTVTVSSPLFVDAQAPAGGDGSSWSGAFRTISAAVAAAPTGNEAIFIAAGTYAEAVTLRGSLRLYGGFSGLNGARETRAGQRRPDVYGVTLTNAAAPVLSFSGTTNALVDGITITGGRALDADGAGVHIANVAGQAFLRDCTIQFNQADGAGGGVLVDDSAARLEDCALLGNTAATGGGLAVEGDNSAVTLENCWIAGNDGGTTGGSGVGGGLNVAAGTVLIENSRIVGNTADLAAGFRVVNGGSSLTLRGTLIAANLSRGWFGGGVNYWKSALQADQCVFFRNAAGSGYGFDGLGSIYSATSTVENCIIAGHRNAEAVGLGWGADLGILRVRHSLFHDNTLDFSDGTVNASGAVRLNALSGVFTNAFEDDPQWLAAPVRAGTVSAVAYDAATRTTRLTLTGAALTPGGLCGGLIRKGASAAAAVFTNTADTITVFGRHDSLAEWTAWQELDFHLAGSSPAVDAGMATASARDPEGFPRGVDLPEVPNGVGIGFDLGLYEHRGSFTNSPLLRIVAAGGSVGLRWPKGLPSWRVHGSTDLRHWTEITDTPETDGSWQQLLRPATEFPRFFRLQAP